MKSSKVFTGLKIISVIGLVLLLSSVAIAENGSGTVVNTGEKKEVLSGLAQRMLKRISVDFREMPIDDVIRIMADQADVDIVKSPNVTGNVTATLTNVPLEEALDNILAAHGYGYVMSKNMIRIAPIGEINQSVERLESRIYRITYADVKDVEATLTKIISDRGSVSSNIGTSNIIVTDVESKIKAIDTFIDEIDRVTPQITVEARIYDITASDSLDLGIEWSAGKNSGVITSESGYKTGKNTNPFIDGTFEGGTNYTDNILGSLNFGFINSSIDIDVLLRAEEENSCATLLANPRIMVLDNDTARIKIIQELAFQELTQTGAGGQIGTTEFREVGVELLVTPHVARDELVRMKLAPKFSINTGQVQQGTGENVNSFPQPIIDRREAETTLLVKSGNTVVLGGLKSKKEQQQTNKIPLLGNLPILGGLFKFEGEETVTSELVVFITPTIIKNPVLSQEESVILGKTEVCSPACDPTIITTCEPQSRK